MQRAPMQDATDMTVESVTMMCASQIIKTTVLENLIGYFIAIDPAPILLVQPTEELAKSFSEERLSPMIRDCPSLAGKVHETRSRDSGNKQLFKKFPGGNIALVGANAPAGLAGRPRRVVLLDEVDRYPASAGKEGDPCALAIRRTESFWNAVIYLTSTPTIKGISRIEAAFEQTDKRRWFCPCPECGHHQHLKWSQVLWGKERLASLKRWHTQPSAERPGTKPATRQTSGTNPNPDCPETPTDGSDAIYECESCHAHLTDTQRLAMVLAGEWRATAPFHGKRGYHLNGIASPFKHKKGFRNRLHQMVAGFLEAKRGGRETYKTWVNTFLAETFEEESEKIDLAPLLERGEDYHPKNLPAAVILVTAGVDIQKDRIEVETVGLGLDDESWGIEKHVIQGDTEQDDVWFGPGGLSEFLATEYQRDDGVPLKITSTAIDMRHKGKKVREFIRKCGLPRIYPVYGATGNNPLLVTTRFNKHYRLRTYAVNGKLAKDTLFARLRIDQPGPRYLHFPKGYGYDEEHFRQLTAEVVKTRYSHGFPIQTYEKIRERNEALDLRVYWLAGLEILRPNLTAIAQHQKPGNGDPGDTTPKIYPLKPAPEPGKPPTPAKRPPHRPPKFPPRRGGPGFNPLGL
jgi:phage terminase large subunit GpA-like protein